MYKLKEIADKVYYVGVNDRQKALFENMWPLPYGVSYNSYLIVDEKTVLIDTVDVCYSDIFLKKVADALDGRTRIMANDTPSDATLDQSIPFSLARFWYLVTVMPFSSAPAMGAPDASTYCPFSSDQGWAP